MWLAVVLWITAISRHAVADLRLASHGFKDGLACSWSAKRGPQFACTRKNNANGGITRVQVRGNIQSRMGPFDTSVRDWTKAPSQWNDIHWRFWEPSTFNYTGLGNIIDRRELSYPVTGGEVVRRGQKNNNYDQFLRSNIDNEQDNRDFHNERGMDHLPFRTWSAEENYRYYYNAGGAGGVKTGPGGEDLAATLSAGGSLLVPMYWNNPHASELEVNIWLFDHSANKPIVVPIKKPACSGEGYSYNVIKFTVPEDFSELGGKIPGFNGCTESSRPMCALQIYSHSVESRTYAIGFPIIIHGHKAGANTNSVTDLSKIEPYKEDPGVEISHLRDVCRSSTDPDADYKKAVPRWARLVSDVYNHAYMNSDYSPYQGQQHDEISQNLQAAAVNKMVIANRGELGRSIVPETTYHRLRQLQLLEDRVYKNYETLANKIIKKVGKLMETTADLETGTEDNSKSKAYMWTCFRCGDVGSMMGHRQETNTYIPSFQMPSYLVAAATRHVPAQYSNLVTKDGKVRIYVQTMLDLLPFYQASQAFGITYQPAMLKDIVDTIPDEANFLKLDAEGKKDHGVWAATRAKLAVAKKMGCDHRCIHGKTTASCGGGRKPAIIKGAFATCVSGVCAPCEKFFSLYKNCVNSAQNPCHVAQLTKLAKDIVYGGPPQERLDGDVKVYADVDGSPRFNRPVPEGGAIIPRPKPIHAWKLAPGVATPKPPTTSPTTPPTTPPTTTRRRRRGSQSPTRAGPSESSRRRRRRADRRRTPRRRSTVATTQAPERQATVTTTMPPPRPRPRPPPPRPRPTPSARGGKGGKGGFIQAGEAMVLAEGSSFEQLLQEVRAQYADRKPT